MASGSISNLDIVQSSLPFFREENYDRWSAKMKTLFRSQNLWGIVENGVIKEGTDAEKLAISNDDAKTLYLLQQSVEDTIFDLIVRFTSAKEAWEHIQTKNHGSSRIISMRRQTLREKFEVLQMREDERVQQICVKGCKLNEARFNRFVDQPIEKVLYVKGEASTSSGDPQESENWSTNFNRGRGYARGRGKGFRGRGRGYDGGGRGDMNSARENFDASRGYSLGSQNYFQPEQ
ncbi:uncharacterized protein LOC120268410 [Dioscorea cayenensis subsp. rotundata]|uniref:Uncharacterized protein LOC120268410 n=1 Tax=Dioscorea cayennensis subsp. rotundata TaxID=55577 RepID=A0AB40BW85_DIOCR|nr:uncharacterized protein LOC120268410 [Dioscorea cayenensis subsp. rotundata]